MQRLDKCRNECIKKYIHKMNTLLINRKVKWELGGYLNAKINKYRDKLKQKYQFMSHFIDKFMP